jgi:hypothetical protein
MPLHAAQLSYEALRVGAPAPSIARTRAALRERCGGRLVTAYAQHALAAAAKDGSALLEVSDELERIGAQRYGTEAAADAARTFVRAGRQDSARRAVARNRELFGRGQGGTLPPIEGLDPGSVGLTPREAELVELASLGLSTHRSRTDWCCRSAPSSRTCAARCKSWASKTAVSSNRDAVIPTANHCHPSRPTAVRS